MDKVIDLRSDTVTKPTDEMREAAKSAEVGDDVFQDDPTVNELERIAAEKVGMEAALFVSSGTQGNLTCVLTHTNQGDEILLEQDSHIYYYEVGGLSAVGGAIPKLFSSDRGYAPKEKIQKNIRSANIHFPNPKLLCLENTHNRHGGVALTTDQIGEMASAGKEKGLNIHLDGARIFNAAVANDVDVAQYTQHVDSIQFCLSKGLSAPVGSIVAGDEEFIKKARKKRKLVGGGMRQAGIIAAPGIIAIEKMVDRLQDDHNNAKTLANGLKEMGIEVFPTDTNIVVCNVSPLFDHSSEAINVLEEKNILAVPFSDKLVRLTTNRHVTGNDVDYVLNQISEMWIN